MKKQQIRTDKIREPVGHFSQAIAIEAQGKLVFLSGMTARRPDGTIAGIGDIEAQTKQVCDNIKGAVEVAKMVSPDYLIEINAIAVVQS